MLAASANWAVVSPSLAADPLVDKDGKRVGPKPNGGAGTPQQPQRQNAPPPPPPQQQLRPVAPPRQPAVQAPPQRPPLPAARSPQVDPRAASRDVQRAPTFDRGRPYERRDGDRYGERRYDDRGRDAPHYGQRRRLALGTGVVILGGVLGYELYRGRDRDSVFDRCDRNFPDFDYDTGSFINEDGDREICPYLID